MLNSAQQGLGRAGEGASARGGAALTCGSLQNTTRNRASHFCSMAVIFFEHAHEGAHDRDVYLGGAFAVEHARQHATPCPVNTSGRKPPRLRREGITFCDSNATVSALDNWNMKSDGNRLRFLFTWRMLASHPWCGRLACQRMEGHPS